MPCLRRYDRVMSNEISTTTIHTSSLRFEALTAGPIDGPPVIALHGFPDHAPTFEPLLNDLAAAGYRVTAPWMPGYAPTEIPADGDYSLGGLARHVVELIDHVSPDRPVSLIGHDWGALVGYAVAGWKPERISHLTTMAVPHMATMVAALLDPQQLKRSWYMFFFQQPTAEFTVANNDMALIDTLWTDWSPGFSPAEGFLDGVKTSMNGEHLGAVLGYYRAMLNPTGPGTNPPADAAAFGAIAVPALYLHGAQDGCMGASTVDAAGLTNFFPQGIDVQVLDGVGHFLHLEDPATVNPLILQALAAPR